MNTTLRGMRAKVKVGVEGQHVPEEHVLRIWLKIELDSRTLTQDARWRLFNALGEALAVLPEPVREQISQQLDAEQKRIGGAA